MPGGAPIARLLLFAGGIAAAFAWLGFSLDATVLDPAATQRAASALLASQPVQHQAARSISEQLVKILPKQTPKAVITKAVTVTLTDHHVQQAFADAIVSVHHAILGDRKSRVATLDADIVTEAVRRALARGDPALARQLPHKSIRVRYDLSSLPRLTFLHDQLPRLTLLATITAIVAWSFAVLVIPNPWTAVHRIGRRLMTIGIGPMILWIVIPAVLDNLHFAIAMVLAPIVRAYGAKLAGPAFSIFAFGLALYVGMRIVEHNLFDLAKKSRGHSVSKGPTPSRADVRA
jgi:hypothetical protein